MLKDVNSQTVNHLQGSVLSSGQKSFLLKRMKTPRVTYNRKVTDEPLFNAFMQLLTETGSHPEELIVNAQKGIADPQLTKDFQDWDNTLKNLKGYFPDSIPNFGYYKAYRNALKIAKNMFSGLELKPISVYRGMDLTTVWSNPDASAGAIGRGSKLDNETDCFNCFDKIKEGIKNGVPFVDLQIPALPAHRAQISGFYNSDDYEDVRYRAEVKQKDRLVWVVDGATNLIECQYGVPLQRWMSSKLDWYAGGKEPSELRNHVHELCGHLRHWVSIDYSKFDQTVPAVLIHDIFKDIIRPIFPKECEEELKFIEFNFIHTQLLLPGKQIKLITKHQGIPSGSLFTQMIGSLANMIIGMTFIGSRVSANDEDLEGYVMRYCFFPDGKSAFSIMGDDNLWGLPVLLNLEDWASYVGKVFHMSIHSEKCCSEATHKFPEYLKREWLPLGERMNPLYIILNVSSPERGPRRYDTYTPWHIIYGMYYTYSQSFENPSLVERYLVDKMEQSEGGLEALRALKTYELPGVLRGYSDKAKKLMYQRAKTIAKNIHLSGVA